MLKMQRFTSKYRVILGVGATPPRWGCRAALAALVAPTPNMTRYQSISITDTKRIRRVSVTDINQMLLASAADTNRIN